MDAALAFNKTLEIWNSLIVPVSAKVSLAHWLIWIMRSLRGLKSLTRFVPQANTWLWQRQDIRISKNHHRRRNGPSLSYVGVEFQRNLSTLIFSRSKWIKWAWQRDDIIFSRNRHHYRVGRGRKYTCTDFQLDRNIFNFLRVKQWPLRWWRHYCAIGRDTCHVTLRKTYHRFPTNNREKIKQ